MWRRLTTLGTNFFRRSVKVVDEGKKKPFGRKAITFILASVTGGVALSAIDDLVIYYGCSRKAMEEVEKNKEILVFIGEPIRKGPWYSASLSVANKRRLVSCSVPIYGSRGHGVLQLKAFSKDEGGVGIPFCFPRDWGILLLDAQISISSSNKEKQQHKIFRIDVSNPIPKDCSVCPIPQKNIPESSSS